MKNSQRAGFTLIELLVVMAVIVVLAGLVLSAAGFVQKKGARSRAEAEIAAIGAALEGYKADFGDYPTNPAPGNYSSPSSNNLLVSALMPSSGKVYYEFNAKFLTTNNNYLDTFGFVYGYAYSATTGSANNGTNYYDLWSTAGESTSTNTWLKNW